MGQSLSRPYLFKCFKGCLPQIVLGPLLNTLSHILVYALDSSFASSFRVIKNGTDLLPSIRIQWNLVPGLHTIGSGADRIEVVLRGKKF